MNKSSYGPRPRTCQIRWSAIVGDHCIWGMCGNPVPTRDGRSAGVPASIPVVTILDGKEYIMCVDCRDKAIKAGGYIATYR